MKSKKPLNELIVLILDEMENAHFSEETRRQYRDVYRRLQKLANARQEMFYSKQLGQAFIEDCNYVGTDEFSHHRFIFINDVYIYWRVWFIQVLSIGPNVHLMKAGIP